MKRIAVIGGGFTGLVAARKLVSEGHHVTVYESGPELGGLAASFKVAGTNLEKAYHHLFRTDIDILSLIDELGLNESLEWRDSSVAIYRNGRIWPFMSPLDLLRFGACSLAGRIRTGLVALYLKKTRNWRKLGTSSALQWMRKSCGMSATESIWAPLLKGKFAENDKNISMAWLWARLHVRSNSRESSSGEKLGYINGGFVKIVDAIEKELLAAGVSILRNSPVMALNGDQRMPQIKTRDSTIAYDAVLFTGSNNAMARILPEDSHLDSYRTDLAAIRYLGAMCHIFTSNQSLGNHYWINVNESKSPFLVFIEHTNLIPCSRYNGKHVYYIGAYLPQDSDNFTKPESQIIQQWYEYLGTMYPHFDPNLIDESHFFRFKDAQHIVDQGYESKILPYETPIPGVFLANFTQIFPEDRGTNFAVREGRRVAQAILNRLNSQGNESRCLH